jgi:hypothetical protein
MSELPNQSRLLSDTLAEGSDKAFRELLLDNTLRRVRLRRRARQFRGPASALAVLVVSAALLWHHSGPRPGGGENGKPYLAVGTHPLAENSWVETQPFSTGRWLNSHRSAEIVTTAAGKGGFREIGDEDLLALAAPNPVVLVRHGPHLAELVFAKPMSQEDSGLRD